MRQISANIQNATFLTITADKTGDVSNKEQLVFAFVGLVTGVRYTKISWNASFGKNRCRSSTSYTKECPNENQFKDPARPWGVS